MYHVVLWPSRAVCHAVTSDSVLWLWSSVVAASRLPITASTLYSCISSAQHVCHRVDVLRIHSFIYTYHQDASLYPPPSDRTINHPHPRRPNRPTRPPTNRLHDMQCLPSRILDLRPRKQIRRDVSGRRWHHASHERSPGRLAMYSCSTADTNGLLDKDSDFCSTKDFDVCCGYYTDGDSSA